MARTKKPKRTSAAVIRSRIRWAGAALILVPLLMWLLVRLDWLRADALRICPPLVVIGIALLAVERFLLRSKRERR